MSSKKSGPVDLTETHYRVKGMDCASCITKIETAVKRLPEVTDVGVSLGKGSMVVHHRSGEAVRHCTVRALGMRCWFGPHIEVARSDLFRAIHEVEKLAHWIETRKDLAHDWRRGHRT